MWLNPQFPADFVTFTKEMLNEKLYFLYSVFFEKFIVNQFTLYYKLNIKTKNWETIWDELITSIICFILSCDFVDPSITLLSFVSTFDFRSSGKYFNKSFTFSKLGRNSLNNFE